MGEGGNNTEGVRFNIKKKWFKSFCLQLFNVKLFFIFFILCNSIYVMYLSYARTIFNVCFYWKPLINFLFTKILMLNDQKLTNWFSQQIRGWSLKMKMKWSWKVWTSWVVAIEQLVKPIQSGNCFGNLRNDETG